MSVRRLRWISVIAPTVFVGAFEIVTRGVYGSVVPLWVHVVVALGAVSVAAFAFSTFMFAAMRGVEREIMVRNRRLALLNSVATEVSESLDLEEVAAAILRNTMQALGADAAGLALVSEEDEGLRLVAHQGLNTQLVTGTGALGPHDCECRKALGLGQAVVIEDTREHASCAGLLGARTAGTCVTAPIRSKGKNVGAVFVVRPRRRPFDSDEVRLVSALAFQVGPALDNAELFSKTGAIAILQERQRVAREVHDGLAQTLGYLNVQMGIVDHLLANGDLERAQGELQTMTAVTREAYGDLREAIMNLRTSVSSGGSIRRGIREYVETFSLQTGILCHFEGHRGSAAQLAPAAEVQLLRIVQEALTNVKKHAPEAEVWLSVEANDRRALVVIRDNGPGFDPAAVAHNGRFGLQTMKERAESSGGNLVIESRPGAGTRLEITVPTEGGKSA